MLDDNVAQCFMIETDGETNCPKVTMEADGSDKVQLQSCSLTSVMLGMELLFDQGNEPRVQEALCEHQTVRFDADTEAEQGMQALATSATSHVSGVSESAHPIKELRDYSGSSHAYDVWACSETTPVTG